MNWPGLSMALLLLASSQALTACDSSKILSMEQTTVLLKGSIQIGASQQEVISQLGEPYRRERHGSTEFLFYQTVWQVADKAATRSPIALVGGTVVGAGKAHYDKIVLAAKQGWGAAVDP